MGFKVAHQTHFGYSRDRKVELFVLALCPRITFHPKQAILSRWYLALAALSTSPNENICNIEV